MFDIALGRNVWRLQRRPIYKDISLVFWRAHLLIWSRVECAFVMWIKMTFPGMIACLFVERRQLYSCQHEHDDDDSKTAAKKTTTIFFEHLKPQTTHDSVFTQ